MFSFKFQIAGVEVHIMAGQDNDLTIKIKPALVEVNERIIIPVAEESAIHNDLDKRLDKLRFFNPIAADKHVLDTAMVMECYKPTGEFLDAARRLREMGLLKFNPGTNLYNGSFSITELGERFWQTLQSQADEAR